jgi:putative multiple sugar transport system permease protein
VNLTNLILQNSYIIIMALGMLLVIVAGHIDLSVGSVVGFVGALAAVLMVNWAGRSWRGDLPRRRRADRGGAGLLGRLLAHPVLHRDAGRHAGVPGLTLWLLAGSRSAPSREFQLLSTGFIPDLFPGGRAAGLQRFTAPRW